MDPVSRSHFETRFELAFRKAKGDAFQDLFSTVMEKRYPEDFQRVRPWGPVGDRKNDGYLRSERKLFQCYAPNELKAKDTVRKMEEDFHGALPHWEAYFDTWVFAHNSSDGLGPEVAAKLLELGALQEHFAVTSWGFEELRRVAMALAEPELASLLGPAPTRAAVMNLGLADLLPILDHIGRFDGPADVDLRPVPPTKLTYSMLSGDAANLLKAGMCKTDLVRKYFGAKPEDRDRMAATFQHAYRTLRATPASPDDIFAGLQRFALGDRIASVTQQSASLAVLAFFFEECDIFERPDEPAPP